MGSTDKKVTKPTKSGAAKAQKVVTKGEFMNHADLGNPQRMFEALIAPLSTEQFFESYYEKKPLVLKRENLTYFNGLFSLNDFKKEVGERESKVLDYQDNVKYISELNKASQQAQEAYNKLETQYIHQEQAGNGKKGKKGEKKSEVITEAKLKQEKEMLMMTMEKLEKAQEEFESMDAPTPIQYGVNVNVCTYNKDDGSCVFMNPNKNPHLQNVPQEMVNKLRLLGAARRSGMVVTDDDLEVVEDDEDTEVDGVEEEDIEADDEIVDLQELDGLRISQALQLLQERKEESEAMKKFVRVGDLEDTLRAGATMVCLHPQQYNYSVWRVLYLLEAYFNCLVGSNCYITPASSQGFAPHHDDVEVFVCQLEGRKKWKLYDPLDELASSVSGDINRELLGPCILEVILEAGDLLYMPRGTIHEAQSLDVLSSHLTVSTMQNQSWLQLLKISMESALENMKQNGSSQWKKALPLQYSHYLGSIHNKVNTEDMMLGENEDMFDTMEGEEGEGEGDMMMFGDEDEDEMMIMDEDEDDEDDESALYQANAKAPSTHVMNEEEEEEDNEEFQPPIYALGDETGQYNRQWLHAGNVNPEKRDNLKKTKYQQAVGNIHDMMSSLMNNMDLHTAADDMIRDFALHRLPPPPSRQEYKSSQLDIAEGTTTTVDSDDEELLTDLEDFNEDICIASRASILGDDGITVSGKGKEEVLIVKNPFEQEDEDEDEEEEEDTSVENGVVKIYSREEGMNLDKCYNILLKLKAGSGIRFVSSDALTCMLENNEDEDDDLEFEVDDDRALFANELELQQSLASHEQYVVIYNAFRQDRATHMGVGAENDQEDSEDEEEEEDMEGMDGEEGEGEGDMMMMDEDEEEMMMMDEDEDDEDEESPHVHTGNGCCGDDDGDDSDELEAEQYDLYGPNPITYSLAVLPVIQRLLEENPRFVRLDELDLDWDCARKYRTLFETIVPFQFLGEEDPNVSEEDLDTEVMSERVKLMYRHWLVCDMFQKGLIEVVLNEENVDHVNFDMEDEGELEMIEEDDENINEDEDEDEDEDIIDVDVGALQTTEQFDHDDEDEDEDDDLLDMMMFDGEGDLINMEDEDEDEELARMLMQFDEDEDMEEDEDEDEDEEEEEEVLPQIPQKSHNKQQPQQKAAPQQQGKQQPQQKAAPQQGKQQPPKAAPQQQGKQQQQQKAAPQQQGKQQQQQKAAPQQPPKAAPQQQGKQQQQQKAAPQQQAKQQPQQPKTQQQQQQQNNKKRQIEDSPAKNNQHQNKKRR